jgi:YVTN family beta-propeller protein
LHVDFTPNDPLNYTTASKDVTINVNRATPLINWSKPADIKYGTPLNNTQLNAVATNITGSNVDGNFTYTLADGTRIGPGTLLNATTQTLHVDFTPNDALNYTTVSQNVTINVSRATPIINWSNPANIRYGTPLSNTTQLNAVATNSTGSKITGIYNYTLADGTRIGPGTLLNAGTYTLYVLFTPNDNANYNNAKANVTIKVLKAYAYITNSESNNVSVIDTETNTVIANVTSSNFQGPAGVAVNPNGTQVYVTDDHASQVCVIDTTTNNIKYTKNVGTEPYGIAVNPEGTKLYVTHKQGSKDVEVINLTNINSASTKINLNSKYYSLGVAVTPDGKKAIVTTYNSKVVNTIYVINTTTDTIITPLTVEDYPYGVAVNPEGTKAYVTNSNRGTVSVIDIINNTVITPSIPVRSSPHGIAVTPNGKKVYVANSGDGSVSVIYTVNNTVETTIFGFDYPEGISINKEGTKAYVANCGTADSPNNTVSVIDTTNNTIIATMNVGMNPIAFGQFIVNPPR